MEKLHLRKLNFVGWAQEATARTELRKLFRREIGENEAGRGEDGGRGQREREGIQPPVAVQHLNREHPRARISRKRKNFPEILENINGFNSAKRCVKITVIRYSILLTLFFLSSVF